MKEIVLKVQDHKFAFLLELLNSLPFVDDAREQRTPHSAKPQDETEYLMRSRANRERLLAAMDEVERGQTQPHDLIEP